MVAGVGVAAAYNLLPFLLHFCCGRSCLVLGDAREILLLLRNPLLLELHYLKSEKAVPLHVGVLPDLGSKACPAAPLE